MSLMIMGLTVVAVLWFALFPSTKAVSQQEQMVYTIVDLTNQARTEANANTLAIDPLLSTAAQAKAYDLLNNDYFSHTSPTGRKPWDFLADVHYRYSYAGENLAINYTDATSVQQAWLDSPSHRENILNPRFTQIGVAAATGEFQGKRTTVIVEMFGTPLP